MLLDLNWVYQSDWMYLGIEKVILLVKMWWVIPWGASFVLAVSACELNEESSKAENVASK